MSHKKKGLLAACLVFMLVVAACGSNAGNNASPSSSSEPSPSSSSSASGSESPSSAASETRAIKHALGETPITGTPKRIVVLEWTYGEDLLALGVQPVGFADIKGYKQWVNVPVQLDADVTDVGTRQEPNLDTIASLKPDLIIGVKFRVEKTYEQLSKIAPTLVFDPYPADDQGDQYEEMEATFKTIADVVGKSAEADGVLADLHQSFDAAKTKLEAAGVTKTPFVLAMAFSNQNAVQFRLSTDNSLAVKILQQIGLTNAYKPKAFEVYGFSTTDVEALPQVQDANFIHIIQETDNVIDNQLKDNAVWKNLTFVKENRLYALGGDTWPYGGPLSAKLMAEKTADLLTKK